VGGPVTGNPTGNARLQAAIEAAANPIQPVPPLPARALDISESVYTFDENIMGWETLKFVFEERAETAELQLSDFPPLEIGMDNLYRLSSGETIGELLLRGRWRDEQTFVIDYPYPAAGSPRLGELGETEFQFKFTGNKLEVTVQQLVFGGEAVVMGGTRK
jgi:hypothetical protein